MTEQIKICRDCKHFSGISQFNHFCTRNVPINVVTGFPHGGGWLLCEVEREDALRLEQSRCGIKAKYWEDK